MALSRARPIRNSKERSGDVSTLDLTFSIPWHTVYALLVSERLSLLSLVPFDNKSIAERQSGAGVCSSKKLYQCAIHFVNGGGNILHLHLVAIKEGSCKSSLNVSHSLVLRRHQFMSHS